jgi:hypothetical protein
LDRQRLFLPGEAFEAYSRLGRGGSEAVVIRWAAVLLLAITGTQAGAQSGAPKPAVPLDPVDAILYMGSESLVTYSAVSKSSCADDHYLQMRLARLQISAGPNPNAQGEELKGYCAKLLATQ